MIEQFLAETSLIKYNSELHEKLKIESINGIGPLQNTPAIHWLNTYGIQHLAEFKEVIFREKLDDFLIPLLKESDHSNKVIELENQLFVAIRVLKTDQPEFDSELMFFIVADDFIWSIQEKQGDYFGWIRERLELNKGIVRKKRADYLLFLLFEAIIDNYQLAYQKYADKNDELLDVESIKPTPEFTGLVEQRKKELFNFKKAAMGLRNTVIKLENIEVEGIDTKYYSELKEQASNLITDIDFELQELESKLNLIFSIQGHRLNEVMKTLTIFSVIFIPLTFMAGIYGMNFKNIPELNTDNGYFILLAAMAVVTLLSVWYFMRKKWF